MAYRGVLSDMQREIEQLKRDNEGLRDEIADQRQQADDVIADLLRVATGEVRHKDETEQAVIAGRRWLEGVR